MVTDPPKKKGHFLSPNVLFSNVVGVVGGVATKATEVAQIAATTVTGAGRQRKQDGVTHLRNIFAVPLDALHHVVGSTIGDSTIAKYKHTSAETKFITESLKDNYLFETLTEHEMKTLASAFELYEIPKNIEDKTDFIIINQGDWATEETAYFYLIYEGKCFYEVNNEVVGEIAQPGDCFGELALLYNCPRAATVKAMTSDGAVKLFRIHQTGFRRILQNENESPDKVKIHLLEEQRFILQNLKKEQVLQLAAAMKPKLFEKGDLLGKKGDPVTEWTVIQRGKVRATNIATSSLNHSGATGDYQDVVLSDGECFNERTLKSSQTLAFDIVADTDGLAFTIEKQIFLDAFGEKYENAIKQSVDAKKLKGVKILSETIQGNTTRVLSYLASLFKDEEYPVGWEICHEGRPISVPAFYFVRKGKVRLTSKRANTDDIIEQEYYFGDDQLLFDTRPDLVASYTATVVEEGTVLGILRLDSCRKILNTKKMGTQDSSVAFLFDSLKLSAGDSKHISVKDLDRVTMLGAGTFGQVWLVTRTGSDGVRHCYALKIQSKYELVQNGQATGVIHEKNIMQQLQHPFVGGLVAAFQDDRFVYMLMPLIQGGELYVVMHANRNKIMSEKHAIFYIAAIAEGLTYMHRRGFVYRDLKPENVLLDGQGFPVIVDFGFAKYVLDKTFTLCGTPLYIAPEVVLNRGHNHGADHWSLGCLAYEMLAGKTPFYEDGMDQSSLFKAIVKGVFTMPSKPPITNEAQSFISGLLTRNPSKRLGSIGIDDVVYHPWLCTVDHDELLLKELKPPYIPSIKDPTDGSNFNDWSHVSDKTKTTYPALKASEAKLFEAF